MTEPGNTLSDNFLYKNRSLSASLTLALIIAVIGVSVITVSIFYYSLSQRAGKQLESKADEYISSLSGLLELPLWDLDVRNITQTGQVFTQNELVEHLKITDHTGKIIFALRKNSGAPLIARSQTITHKDKNIGAVEIALTAKYYNEFNHRSLLLCLGIVSAVVLVLTCITGFLLRILLTRPLNQLGKIVNTYAAGRYSATGYDTSILEFQPLVRVLQQMGDEITSRIRQLQDAEKKYRDIFENAVEGIFQFTPAGQFLSANPSMARILGYSDSGQLLDLVTDAGRQLFVDYGQYEEFLRTMEAGNITHGFHVQLHHKNGGTVWTSLHAHPVFAGNGTLMFVEGLLEDISEYKQAEAERRHFEDKLRQSQKMETVGLLAGGIAHDFNNLLTPIIGYAELLAKSLPGDDPMRSKLDQISLAADRARELVSRLLSFSRKQMIELKKVSLGVLIGQFEAILRRTIRENIDIQVSVSPSAGLIKADQGQIEQILINLAINAQDAMPAGGRLTIEATDVELDTSYTGTHPEVTPGNYVMLAISDTGIGMDQKTLEHIFDPFYTTKELGKGTGLGLSTVYGIVKMHGGSISVYSEKQHGSTFKIFLPRLAGEDETFAANAPSQLEPAHGTETVLIVEDDSMVRNLTYSILKNLGYQVVVAENPDHCLALVSTHTGPIHLLLTDVVMPGMNGKELFEHLRSELPALKVLFMSGYTTNVIMRHGVIYEGIHFIQKPFSMLALSQKIRDVLTS